MVDWGGPESTPRASAERIEAFVSKYCDAAFPHSVDVLRLMARNAADESRIAVYELNLNNDLRAIYRQRAALLASRPTSSPYPDSLAQDVGVVAERLDAAPDQPITVWSIELPDGTAFRIFVLAGDGAIAGCVKSIDRRVVR